MSSGNNPATVGDSAWLQTARGEDYSDVTLMHALLTHVDKLQVGC